LKAAGKSPWPHQVAVRPLLQAREANLLPAELVDTAREIAKLLRSGLPEAWMDVKSTEWDRDLEEMLEYFENCTAEDFQSQHEESVDLLDQRLDELYDWSDRHRVWLG